MAFELLPPGFVFMPSDELLLSHYLIAKITEKPLHLPQDFSIPELDLYDQPPWELFSFASGSRYLPNGTFYCFVRVKRSSIKSRRLKRKTHGGTWEANGTPCNVLHNGRAVIGTRTALKFFREGDKSRSKKDQSLGTDSIMHEYCLRATLYKEISSSQAADEIIMCRIHHKQSRKPTDVDQKEDDGRVASFTQKVTLVAEPSPSTEALAM